MLASQQKCDSSTVYASVAIFRVSSLPTQPRKRIRRFKPAQTATKVSSPELIQAGFAIPFFAGKLVVIGVAADCGLLYRRTDSSSSEPGCRPMRQ
jgi:hypothetical protein